MHCKMFHSFLIFWTVSYCKTLALIVQPVLLQRIVERLLITMKLRKCETKTIQAAMELDAKSVFSLLGYQWLPRAWRECRCKRLSWRTLCWILHQSLCWKQQCSIIQYLFSVAASHWPQRPGNSNVQHHRDVQERHFQERANSCQLPSTSFRRAKRWNSIQVMKVCVFTLFQLRIYKKSMENRQRKVLRTYTCKTLILMMWK